MCQHNHEPRQCSLRTQMTAGALSGLIEHSIMYPVDCVRTRMQCLQPAPEATYSGLTDGLFQLLTREGVRRSFKGVSAVLFSVPAHALYFACYEQTKRVLSDYANHNHPTLTNGLAGSCATILHDTVMTPADIVKQRMQLYGSTYNGCRDCVQRVVSEEGVRALYRSYAAQLLMNVPFGVTYFVTYEATQDKLNAQREYRPLTHIISGAISGGAAAALSTPLDVCKTVLNTHNHNKPAVNASNSNSPLTGKEAKSHDTSSQVIGIRQAFARVYATYGVGGFLRGIQARVVQQMPATAISWSVYEFFKWRLTPSCEA